MDNSLDLTQRLDRDIVLWILGKRDALIFELKYTCLTGYQSQRIRYIKSLPKNELETALEAHKLLGL